MTDEAKKILYDKIQRARVISFDVFDTLLFRKVGCPENIFDIIGNTYAIRNFRKLRVDAQHEASRRTYRTNGYPHADMQEIYAVLSENTDYPVDWEEVRRFEIDLEADSLVANPEMLSVFHYCQSLNKRIVITTDMYLSGDTVRIFLEKNGFTGAAAIYCSADLHKAKFNKEIFAELRKRENVSYAEILHIGDSQSADAEIPASFGMDTFLYRCDADMDKVRDVNGSLIDNGFYKILYDANRSFFYNLGIEVGGPMYAPLYQWLYEKVARSGRKLFFLSRDGYNLYRLFQKAGVPNIAYLHTSRRALILAGLTELTEESMKDLPPYNLGQSLQDIFDYLLIPTEQIQGLQEAGFTSFADTISSEEDFPKVYKLYQRNAAVILERARYERENAKRYLDSIGFLDGDNACFDCGWCGTSQYALDHLKEVLGCKNETVFYYYGLLDKEKTHRQMRGRRHECFLFDYYNHYILQDSVRGKEALYELFFSSPDAPVQYYGEDGPVFTKNQGIPEKADLLDGILRYLTESRSYREKYAIEESPSLSIGHMTRLVESPTVEEAVKIGNIDAEDSFAKSRGVRKAIAYITAEQFDRNPDREIYWMSGFLKRPDIPEFLKERVALKYAIPYPKEISPYHLEDGQSLDHYKEFRRQWQKWVRKKDFSRLPREPKLSVVMPVYNTIDDQLREAIDSVLCQNYANYELILVDDASTWPSVRTVLSSYEQNPHVKVLYRAVNGHISESTNTGIEAATGDYIVFMDCDDTIEPTALYFLAEKVNENPDYDFIYSDHDNVTEDGKVYHFPSFKPEWSPELFMSLMYTNHLAMYRTSLVREAGGLKSAYNGSQDYEFTLRFMDHSDRTRVGHVPHVLYHWRERRESLAFASASKSYAPRAAAYARADRIREKNLPAHMEELGGSSQYICVYEVVGNPLVSIVIPSKDHPEVLQNCITSIERQTTYTNYEWIVVDNGSSPENRAKTEAFLKTRRAKYLYQPSEFNFSAMCNAGAAAAGGEYVLLLNDDTEAFQPDWLSRLLGMAERPGIGAVGCKLFYTDSSRLQHAGISSTAELGPAHEFFGDDDRHPYYFAYPWVSREVLAVTAACLLIRKSIYDEVGGLDESFPVAYNDVEFCYRVYKKGYSNIYRGDAVLYHHESLSRGIDRLNQQKEKNRVAAERRLYRLHPEFNGKDPFRSPNLYDYRSCLYTVCNKPTVRRVSTKHLKKSGRLYVDFCTVDHRLYIGGWSALMDKKNNGDFEREIVLKDPFGYEYAIHTTKSRRLNCCQLFKRDDLYYAGFDAIADLGDLPADFVPYEIGILTHTGKRDYITWSHTTVVGNVPRERPIRIGAYPDSSRETGDWKTEYAFESIRDDGEWITVKGWSVTNGSENYRFRAEVVLKFAGGSFYAAPVTEEERPDIMRKFSASLFLHQVGWTATIPKADLPAEEYNVFLRVRERVEA